MNQTRKDKMIELGYDAYLNQPTGTTMERMNPFVKDTQEYGWFVTGWEQAKKDSK